MTPPDPAPPGAGAGWGDDSTARAWAAQDRQQELLDLPRRMAVAIAAGDLGRITRVVDVGSGPGTFLAVALGRCAQASGVWIDVSPAMEAIARERLGDLAGRVQYLVSDLTSLHRLVPAGSADLVLSSRVTHHLGGQALAAFYRDVATALRPGGWVANLDHITVDHPWEARLRSARAEFVPASHSSHRHDYPLPTVGQHLEALADTGFTDAAVPWRAFWSVLILAKSSR